MAEEYSAMADQWYKFGAGFLLVYSITDRPTFDAVRGYHQDILRAKDLSYAPCVVVSNKVCVAASSSACRVPRLRPVRSRQTPRDLHPRRTRPRQVPPSAVHRVLSGRRRQRRNSFP